MSKDNQEVSETIPKFNPNLVLGWKINKNFEPEYWLKADKPKAGEQDDNDLIMVKPESIDHHTAIIAQSGSGKSFFLGRFIEEIVTKTKSNCIIFDPNADFTKVRELEGPSQWPGSMYKNSRGKLHTELQKSDFTKLWPSDKIIVESSNMIGKMMSTITNSYIKIPIKINWQDISIDFIAEELDPIDKSTLYHFHNFFINLIYFESFKIRFHFVEEKKLSLDDVLSKSFKLLNDLEKASKSLNETAFEDSIDHFINYKQLLTSYKKFPEHKNVKLDSLDIVMEYYKSFFLNSSKFLLNQDIRNFYFGKLTQYINNSVIENNLLLDSKLQDVPRIRVIDLPSLSDYATKLLIINSILQNIWENAKASWSKALNISTKDDSRVPTFIIIDEAHNLIPSNPIGVSEKALLEQFRRIIAEGRKFGLFLIIASQRPDKLDSMILSECENKVIMKLSSSSVLKNVIETINLEDVPYKLLSKCLDFESGRGFLIGNWVPEIFTAFYSAARRSIEGGRNLQAKHWATPDPNITKDSR